MGIVYSSKVVAIEESLLYTRENYFTGSCPVLLTSALASSHPTVVARLRTLLGRLDRGSLQPSLRNLCWRHRLDGGTSRCRGPRIVREGPYCGGVW